ncbi:polysaccharide biosynthesis/export family protein [Pedobacter foliorum]|uniref:polysaccharide biosynthesis/export family protein n=1 Tax=Pedobacter foliorum TaxID=2739058 RepID=UPI00156735DC|nr:polysaccharide biosynthesis/export family protein [Pedobacter foliorum]NRF37240.1 polysaccharide biosynthesis/export family protein [Pedobacter foliorum]
MNLKYVLCYLVAITLSSCSRQRNLVYFSDLKGTNENTSQVLDAGEPTILKNDILGITVNSTSPESNLLFASVPSNPTINGVYEREGYRVSSDGVIKFPVLGQVKLEGLTIGQAQALMEKELSKYVKNAIVNIKFMNFRVTVIGEVNHPSTFTVTNEKINLLEALGLAGDMTPYGKRENVLLIREVDGTRKMERVNLNSKEVLNSPYFYLKQNDVIYVEPDKAKSVEVSNNNRLMPLIVAAISAVAVLATTFLNK